MDAKHLEKFFNPKSIAIIGATDGKGKVGRALTENIITSNYRGKVYLVNPNRKVLFWKKCYPCLEDIKNNVDLAIVAIPAKFVADVLRKGAKKCKNFVVISAGFSEIGDEGKKREKEMKEIAEKNKLNILGPNCLGFLNPFYDLNASFAGAEIEEGNISFITQSGALAVALLDMAKNKGLGFSKIISVGNEMQINETNLLEYLEKDSDTNLIGLYLEGIKDGSGFAKAAERVGRKKPVVVLKAGITKKSQKAISSHTGALAGDNEIINAVFKKAGIIRAENLEEFVDILELISKTEAPKNNQVAIVTNAGGAGVVATDAFHGKEIELAEFSGQTIAKLKKVLPFESATENPVDLLGDAEEDRYEKVLKIINREKAGTVICLLTPQHQTPVKKIAKVITDFRNHVNKTVLAGFIGGERVEEAIFQLEKQSIPNYEFPGRAVQALDSYWRWNVFSRSNQAGEQSPVNQERKQRVSEIIQRAKAQNRPALLFSEASEIINLYNINTVESYLEAELLSEDKFPVAVKIDSAKVLHKTDQKALILDIKNHEELEKAINEFKTSFPGKNIIVQPMLERKTELILGIKKDEIFGPVIMFGLGGIYTEVLKLVDFAVPPLSIEEAKKALSKSKINYLFNETRGQKSYDSNELAGIIQNLSNLAQEVQEIKEIDINPLLVYNDGRKAVAVDVKIVI